MPTANTFTTLGAFNGFPGCVAKIDVSSYDKWTTLSGFNKDAAGTPTSAQVRDSHKLAVRLYWNLHQVTAYTFDLALPAEVDNLIVTGEDWTGGTVADAIQPRERMCSGSISTYTVEEIGIATRAYGRVDLTLETGIVRMYDGVTTSETNFIGYGMGEIDFDEDKIGSISTSANDGEVVSAEVSIGGYGNDATAVLGDETESSYIVTPDLLGNDFNVLFFAYVGSTISTGYTLDINSTTRTATALSSGVAQVQAEITSLDFWTYP
mgnify:CR=1 FL=1